MPNEVSLRALNLPMTEDTCVVPSLSLLVPLLFTVDNKKKKVCLFKDTIQRKQYCAYFLRLVRML
jgi:hypothetical protein